jgi:hypothetical protein
MEGRDKTNQEFLMKKTRVIVCMICFVPGASQKSSMFSNPVESLRTGGTGALAPLLVAIIMILRGFKYQIEFVETPSRSVEFNSSNSIIVSSKLIAGEVDTSDTSLNRSSDGIDAKRTLLLQL